MCIGKKIKVAFAHERVQLLLLEKIFSISWEIIDWHRKRESERKGCEGKEMVFATSSHSHSRFSSKSFDGVRVKLNNLNFLLFSINKGTEIIFC